MIIGNGSLNSSLCVRMCYASMNEHEYLMYLCACKRMCASDVCTKARRRARPKEWDCANTKNPLSGYDSRFKSQHIIYSYDNNIKFSRT